MNVDFAMPGAWPLLLLAPATWVLLRLRDRLRAGRLERVAGPRAALLAHDLAPRRRRFGRALMAGGVALAALAVMQPRWGETLRRIEQRGVDVLVCIDVSRSMLARDVPPTRLDRARAAVRDLAGRVRGDRLGLVVFAGEARLTVPLTQDMRSYAELIELAEPSTLRRGGTDLGAALECAFEALGDRDGQHATVVLITDGEDHGARGLALARRFRDRGVAVHCVGLGSSRGSKIAIETVTGEAFLRDADGNEVVTAMDPVSLRKLAEATGGSFLDGRLNAQPLVTLYERRVLPMARRVLDDERRRERETRFQWPLLLAVLLWAMQLGLTDRSVR